MNKFLNKKNIIIFFSLIILISIGYYLKMLMIFDKERLTEIIINLGIWGPIVYILIYITVTIVGVSAAIFTILAGTLFGVKKALFIVVIGATIAASIAFFIARYFRENIFNSNKNKKSKLDKIIKKIENNAESRGFVTIVILRLSFLPYIPLSYASGLVKKLKARDFILATFLTNIFGSFVFIFLGASITQSIPIFLGAIILVLLFMQIPKLIKKFSN